MHDIAGHQENAGNVDLIAGWLCLDYVNTISRHGDTSADEREELLRTYADLVAWARHAEVLTAEEAARLRAAGAHQPERAETVLAHATALREALYRIFTAATRRQPADASDIARFNAALARTLAQARIAPDAAGYAWAWSGVGDELDALLWPVVRSAADLLTNAAELERVRACAGERCEWLFLDTSRNHSRRWCSMDDCGNRAKARRHYQRQREVESQP